MVVGFVQRALTPLTRAGGCLPAPWVAVAGAQRRLGMTLTSRASSEGKAGATAEPRQDADAADTESETFKGSSFIRAHRANRFDTHRSRSIVTQMLWNDRLTQEKQNKASTTNTSAAAAASKPHVLTKRMSDSYSEIHLPFGSSPALREDYISVYGHIRFGKLLEDIDAFAANVAYKHCDDNNPATPPLTIVTASVDRIDILNPLRADEDVALTGFVSWVGTSSMEVSVSLVKSKELAQLRAQTFPQSQAIMASSDRIAHGSNPAITDIGTPELFYLPGEIKCSQLLTASVTMVARDPRTQEAAQVNRIVPTNPEEAEIFEHGEANKMRRKANAERSLMKQPPTAEESALIHSLFLQRRAVIQGQRSTSDVILMKDTIMNSTNLCQPQDRNIHNRIFGGWLMRNAFELAWTTASFYCQSRPIFVALDDITFRKPVEIGAILSYSSLVTYSPGAPRTSFQVSVRADVLNIETGSRETTNVFHFAFLCRDKPLKPVLPETYGESMKYVEAMRRHLHGQNFIAGKQPRQI